ncbi:MAG TPA: M48 family metallopeptidase [Usitatibacter sp.]|jgi:STE24 endopeptidase|nr:M48 family metallopeptidase [Usitatibacter sp.]
MRLLTAALLSILLAVAATGVSAAPLAPELPPGLQVPADARPGPAFDIDKATAAYLGLLSPAQRERSDAYFEGGYWIGFWALVYGLGVSFVLLATGLSVRMRDAAERVSRRPWLSTLLYALMWIAVSFLLTFPFSIYADFVREHQYGLSEQPFGSWLADQLKGLGVQLVLTPIVLVAIYAAVRRAGARWWTWATAIFFAFNVLTAMIAPVFIAPLFNHYQPLPPGPVRDAVLSLARANEVPTDHVEWFDASKQTTRISANVSGLWGTTRLSLNDNLLKRTSLPEVKAVLGHEMGHYVMHHPLRFAVYLTLVFGIAFALLHVAFDRALARWGRRWRLRDRTDPAALPLAAAILSVILYLAGPLVNGIVRQAENEADAYGLNAAREPYGFAMVSMRLSTYRKIEPGPLEEVLFFDHPSGYERVRRAMTWLRENPSVESAAAR